MPVETIHWVGAANGHARMVDQTELPGRFIEIDCRSVDEMYDAIRRLKVRGAPALALAAAFGTLLGAKASQAEDPEAFLREIGRVTDHLATSRPTAVNLFWGLDRMKRAVKRAYHRIVPAPVREWVAIRTKYRRLRTTEEWGFSLIPFDRHECIFVHIPKTGGVSISKSLFGNLAGGVYRPPARMLSMMKL